MPWATVSVHARGHSCVRRFAGSVLAGSIGVCGSSTTRVRMAGARRWLGSGDNAITAGVRSTGSKRGVDAAAAPSGAAPPQGQRAAGHCSGRPVAHRRACRPTPERTPHRREHSEPASWHPGSCSVIADDSVHPQLGHLDVPSLCRPTTSNPEERGHVTPGKYVVLYSDRVNCRQRRCPSGSCWSIS